MGETPKTADWLERMMKQVAEIAAEKGINAYRETSAAAQKEKYDRRYRNVKLLLEHYRDFSNYGEKAVYRIYEAMEKDEDIADILDLMEGRRKDEDGKIESIEKGVIRTKVIMRHVNEMLNIYKISCRESPYQEEKRRWRVIYALYLSDEPKTVQEIAEEEYINERTVYKDVKAACKRLTALIFGIDGFER